MKRAMLNLLALAIVMAGSATIAAARDHAATQLRQATSASCTSTDEQAKCVCPGACVAGASSCECR